MDIAELLNYRKTLLDDCKDDDGTFSESNLVNNILDNLLDAKIIDITIKDYGIKLIKKT